MIRSVQRSQRCVGGTGCSCPFCQDSEAQHQARASLELTQLRDPGEQQQQQEQLDHRSFVPREIGDTQSAGDAGSLSRFESRIPMRGESATTAAGADAAAATAERKRLAFEAALRILNPPPPRVPSLVQLCLKALFPLLPDLLCADVSSAPPHQLTTPPTHESTHTSGASESEAPDAPEVPCSSGLAPPPCTLEQGGAGEARSGAGSDAPAGPAGPGDASRPLQGSQCAAGCAPAAPEGDRDAEREDSPEDAALQFSMFTALLPTSLKQSLSAMARRQLLLSDCLLLNGYLDCTWRLLDVSRSSGVSDATLEFAAAHCRRLEALDVRFCEAITSSGILAVLRGCPELHTLRLGGCPSSNAAARAALRQMLQELLPVAPVRGSPTHPQEGQGDSSGAALAVPLEEGQGDSAAAASRECGRAEQELLPPAPTSLPSAVPAHREMGAGAQSGFRERGEGATGEAPKRGRSQGQGRRRGGSGSRRSTKAEGRSREGSHGQGEGESLPANCQGGHGGGLWQSTALRGEEEGGSACCIGVSPRFASVPVEAGASDSVRGDVGRGEKQPDADIRACAGGACNAGADVRDGSDGACDVSADVSWEDMAEEGALPAMASSLRCIVWPEIDKKTLRELSCRCPRIRVNPPPRHNPFGQLGRAPSLTLASSSHGPCSSEAFGSAGRWCYQLQSSEQGGSTTARRSQELSAGQWHQQGGATALLRGCSQADRPLDEAFVQELGLTSLGLTPFWGSQGLLGHKKRLTGSTSEGDGATAEQGQGQGQEPETQPKRQSIAELFRQAFEERERRLAPSRARKARQQLRRENQRLLEMDPGARAQHLASMWHHKC